MFYKVSENSKLFKQLQELNVEAKKARKATSKMLKSIPNSTSLYVPSSTFAGGIEEIGFKNIFDIPKDWVQKREAKGHYFAKPRTNRKSCKEILAKFEALPKVTYDKFNNLIKYDAFITTDKYHTITWIPRVRLTDNMCLIVIDEEYFDCGYKPVAGMKEITRSEFEKLWNEK